MLFHFFIHPHSSPFVIRLKKPTGHWFSIHFAAPNRLNNQWSFSCLRRMTWSMVTKKRETTVEMLFHFFIRPHLSPFVICLKKPIAPNWLENQWSVSCLRRMTNGDEQKRETTSQLISQLMMMISRLGARLAARVLFMKPFNQKEGGTNHKGCLYWGKLKSVKGCWSNIGLILCLLLICKPGLFTANRWVKHPWNMPDTRKFSNCKASAIETDKN